MVNLAAVPEASGVRKHAGLLEALEDLLLFASAAALAGIKVVGGEGAVKAVWVPGQPGEGTELALTRLGSTPAQLGGG